MLADEIRQHLRRLLAGEDSLKEFENWFLPATWELTVRGSEESELASAIRLLLVEADLGHRTEQEVREGLGQIDRTTLQIVSTGATVSGNVMVELGVAEPLPV